MQITIVELPEFIRRAKNLLHIEEYDELLFYLSVNPTAGNLLQGTGGIRKLRWTSKSKGKRGGVRVIYFFYNESIPLFLLSVFSKSEKVNLSKSERNELAKLTNLLLKNYKQGNSNE